MEKINLHNKKNKEDLLQDLNNENFSRMTISFYKYIKLNNLETLREELYIEWSKLKVLGRIYLAKEGINAQLSIPENNYKLFINTLFLRKKFKQIKIKHAIQEGTSFLKLTIKIKNEIVAYKLSNEKYDMNNVGKHLNYKEFNEGIDNGAVVIDTRNNYESEVGRFENAIIPDIDRSEDLLPEIKKLLIGKEENKILMYCTGGIRCEKASSYLIKQGFKDVNQLEGGIVNYANQINKNNIKSKFIGKNFVFDNRMGENITNDIISKCHQCNVSNNNHTNCNNEACHILFIQCKDCINKYNGCCSEKCKKFILLNKKERAIIIKEGKIIFNGSKSDILRPKLYNMSNND